MNSSRSIKELPVHEIMTIMNGLITSNQKKLEDISWRVDDMKQTLEYCTPRLMQEMDFYRKMNMHIVKEKPTEIKEPEILEENVEDMALQDDTEVFANSENKDITFNEASKDDSSFEGKDEAVANNMKSNGDSAANMEGVNLTEETKSFEDKVDDTMLDVKESNEPLNILNVQNATESIVEILDDKYITAKTVPQECTLGMSQEQSRAQNETQSEETASVLPNDRECNAVDEMILKDEELKQEESELSEKCVREIDVHQDDFTLSDFDDKSKEMTDVQNDFAFADFDEKVEEMNDVLQDDTSFGDFDDGVAVVNDIQDDSAFGDLDNKLDAGKEKISLDSMKSSQEKEVETVKDSYEDPFSGLF